LTKKTKRKNPGKLVTGGTSRSEEGRGPRKGRSDCEKKGKHAEFALLLRRRGGYGRGEDDGGEKMFLPKERQRCSVYDEKGGGERPGYNLRRKRTLLTAI